MVPVCLGVRECLLGVGASEDSLKRHFCFLKICSLELKELLRDWWVCLKVLAAVCLTLCLKHLQVAGVCLFVLNTTDLPSLPVFPSSQRLEDIFLFPEDFLSCYGSCPKFLFYLLCFYLFNLLYSVHRSELSPSRRSRCWVCYEILPLKTV